MMRIIVSSADAPAADSRAYAEYRFFTSVAPYEGRLRSVDVVVRRDRMVSGQFLCTAIVDLGPSGRIKTQARAAHPSGAIDRAADRIAWLIGRRIGRDFIAKSPGFIS